MAIVDRVLTLQGVPFGGFKYINSSLGLQLQSGQSFYIDNVYTGFFPKVSPFSSDQIKFSKQKWLSIGLEGNSFRRYINENINLQGIPSGLQPGSFVYFTIEPKSSLLEFGAGSNFNNQRYITALRAKPYMVVLNDANKDNSYERTPSNLFTGVSGNNNFVRFHPSSRYGNLALQAIRFHPVIGNGYKDYLVGSGTDVYVQPKNHHLETFMNFTIRNTPKSFYVPTSRSILPSAFTPIASGVGLFVTGALEPEANGTYVGLTQAYNYNTVTDYVNENNWRLHRLTINLYGGQSETRWTISAPSSPAALNIDNLNAWRMATTTENFTPVYRQSLDNPTQPFNGRRTANQIILGYSISTWISMPVVLPQGFWQKIDDPSKTISVQELVQQYPYFGAGYACKNILYHAAGGWNNFNNTTQRPSGAWIDSRLVNNLKLNYGVVNNKSKFVTNVYPYGPTDNASYTEVKNFLPRFIYNNQENWLVFPDALGNFSSIGPGQRLAQIHKIFFKRPQSANLHQAKKVSAKFNFEADSKVDGLHRVRTNYWPITEYSYTGYARLIQCFDQRDSDNYGSSPFYSISGKGYSFDQNEIFIYKSRPDLNNPNLPNVVKW